MVDMFKEFVEAELREIMDSMDEHCRQDPDLCRQIAIEWIDKNAKLFRDQWNLKKKVHNVS